MAWGFAKQEYSPLKGQLFAAMYATLLEDAALLGRFGEQDMSQFMWAASYLEQPPPPALMDAIARVALDKLDTFSGAVVLLIGTTPLAHTAVTAQKFVSSFDNMGYAPLEHKLAREVSKKIHTRSMAGRVAPVMP